MRKRWLLMAGAALAVVLIGLAAANASGTTPQKLIEGLLGQGQDRQPTVVQQPPYCCSVGLPCYSGGLQRAYPLGCACYGPPPQTVGVSHPSAVCFNDCNPYPCCHTCEPVGCLGGCPIQPAQ